MAISDIPVFRSARAGQIVRSDDWNEIQRLLRNAVRQHRHTRTGDGDDASLADDATQLGTSEIANNAVTSAKIAGGAIVRRVLAADLLAKIDAANANVATGVATATPGQPLEVTHGLGARAVAVLLAQSAAKVAGLEGDFDIYGGLAGTVAAAVPVPPKESFFLTTTGQAPVQVRWFAIAINAGALR